MFDPEKVESVLWKNFGDDGWQSPEMGDLGEDSEVEMVMVGDFNKLEYLYRVQQDLLRRLYEDRKDDGYHDDFQEEIADLLGVS